MKEYSDIERLESWILAEMLREDSKIGKDCGSCCDHRKKFYALEHVLQMLRTIKTDK